VSFTESSIGHGITEELIGQLPDAILIGDRTKDVSGPGLVNDSTTSGTGMLLTDPKQLEPPVISPQRLRSWHEDGGLNIRTLLSSLHKVAPPGASCAWEKTSLGELVDHGRVQRAYRRSLLAVHPDRLPSESKDAGQKIFDRLREAWNDYNAHTDGK